VSRRRRCGAALATAAVLLAATAACGAEQAAPVDQQPRLAAMLSAVDDAISAGRYQNARHRLDDLVKAAVSARGAGTLDNSSADRVLASAAGLMTQLTASTKARRAAATPSESTAPAEGAAGAENPPKDEKPPRDEKPPHDEHHGHDSGHDHGPGHGHGHGPGHGHEGHD
jgi:hypothetical protein